MSLRHIWAVTRKEFNHILRDRSTLFLVLFTPTFLLLLMAYALTVDIVHVPVAVLDYDQSKISRGIRATDHGWRGFGYLCIRHGHGRNRITVDAGQGQSRSSDIKRICKRSAGAQRNADAGHH